MRARRTLMRELGADESLRCLVLRGAGDKAFAAGADIAEFANERANSAQAKAYGEDGIGWMHAVAECRHPTVALIQGACVGGGLLIASQCDLRICNESARFGVPVKNLGLTESYDELQGMMRVDRARGVASKSCSRVASGARAKPARRGSSAASCRTPKWSTEAYAAARRIAQGAPLVARWHKKFIRRLPIRARLSAEEHDEGYACFDTEDFREGVAAFLAKRKPRFTAR